MIIEVNDPSIFFHWTNCKNAMWILNILNHYTGTLFTSQLAGAIFTRSGSFFLGERAIQVVMQQVVSVNTDNIWRIYSLYRYSYVYLMCWWVKSESIGKLAAVNYNIKANIHEATFVAGNTATSSVTAQNIACYILQITWISTIRQVQQLFSSDL